MSIVGGHLSGVPGADPGERQRRDVLLRRVQRSVPAGDLRPPADRGAGRVPVLLPGLRGRQSGRSGPLAGGADGPGDRSGL